MPSIRNRLALLLLVALAGLTVAACGDDNSGGNSGSSSSQSATADSCSKSQLALVNSGQLTVGTDKPAFPPYFEDDDPTNGKGFESAVAGWRRTSDSARPT